MAHVDVDTRGPVRVLAMARPPANALNESLVEELAEAVGEAEVDDAVGAIVLTSSIDGFFSVGFDVREVFDYDRVRMGAYWRDFVALYERIYASEKPIVAGLAGHTFAGGILLALACDVRVMANGDFGLGVSGINLGVPLPLGAMNMAVNAIGAGHARRLFLTGETIDPHQAHALGLVHDLVDPGSLRDAAIARATELAGKSPEAFRAIHTMFDRLSGRDKLGSDTDRIESFLDFWFSDEAERYKQATRDRLERAK